MLVLTWGRLVELKKTYLIIEKLITMGTVIFIMLAWYVVTDLKIFSEFMIPTPAKVYSSLKEILAGGYKGNSLFKHLTDSMIRLLAKLDGEKEKNLS